MRSPSTSPSSPPPAPSIQRKFLLLTALLFTLGLLNDVNEPLEDHGEADAADASHLAVLTALSRHPPSLRVFRLMYAVCFALYCAAGALWVFDAIGIGDEARVLLFPAEVRTAQSTSTPSSTSILRAALDLTILSSACLLCFTVASAEGGRYIHTTILGNGPIISSNNNTTIEYSYLKVFCEATAPLFPLGLFSVATYRALFPWNERGKVWITLLGMTVGAPFCEVTFRDGFIGDVITSAVRPLQDLLFTIFFLPLGLHAYWSSYTIDAAAIPIERNWIVHTVLLPACTLSPQWWRFCQSLRQSYDAKKRWPYLGNAFKYMFAAEVATFGMFDPSMKRHPLWMCCFAGATLYQVWWDVFMDWGLLEWNYVERRFALRSERLYQQTYVYYLIFVINFLLRFVGMLTLIPPVHLSRTTGLIVKTFPDYWMFVGSLAACAEIFRRTVWALLRLEWEVIKTKRDTGDDDSCGIHDVHVECDDVELPTGMMLGNDMKPMSIGTSVGDLEIRNTFKTFKFSDMSNLNDIQILTELGVWATVFSGVAIIAAAHREVL